MSDMKWGNFPCPILPHSEQGHKAGLPYQNDLNEGSQPIYSSDMACAEKLSSHLKQPQTNVHFYLKGMTYLNFKH